MITYEDVKNNIEVKALVEGSQKQLNALGYTEHSVRHVTMVANRAAEVLEALEYPKERIELAKIAGYMHDIGNCVNRVDHAHTGAILAYQILKGMGLDPELRTEIMMAIGNHDEQTGTAVSDISAALILADKSDVHRSRVVNKNISTFDKHDKVNYAVTNSEFIINKNERKVTYHNGLPLYLASKVDFIAQHIWTTIQSIVFSSILHYDSYNKIFKEMEYEFYAFMSGFYLSVNNMVINLANPIGIGSFVGGPDITDKE